MKKLILLILGCLFLFSFPIFSLDMKVANFSFGKPDTKEYEEFSFWVKDSKRSEIIYRYGKWENQKDLELVYLGISVVNNEKCFKVKFSNDYELFIFPQTGKLKVLDNNGKYNKIFKWKYEGPINGRGTFCDVCAEDENAAIDLINQYFMK